MTKAYHGLLVSTCTCAESSSKTVFSQGCISPVTGSVMAQGPYR